MVNEATNTAAALKQIVSNLKRISADLDGRGDFEFSRAVWMEADELDRLAVDAELAAQDGCEDEIELSAAAEDRLAVAA